MCSEAMRRQLRKRFEVVTANGGAEGLKTIADGDGFAVIVSDLRMPEMDGIKFLSHVRERFPDSVRIMLTGNADVESAIHAVNEGHLFRFLTKPCPPDQLIATLEAGIEQHRLITAEKELLEKTLKGSIKILTDILSLICPAAFGRASRVRRLARRVAAQLNVNKVWQVEIGRDALAGGMCDGARGDADKGLWRSKALPGRGENVPQHTLRSAAP